MCFDRAVIHRENHGYRVGGGWTALSEGNWNNGTRGHFEIQENQIFDRNHPELTPKCNVSLWKRTRVSLGNLCKHAGPLGGWGEDRGTSEVRISDGSFGAAPKGQRVQGARGQRFQGSEGARCLTGTTFPVWEPELKCLWRVIDET